MISAKRVTSSWLLLSILSFCIFFASGFAPADQRWIAPSNLRQGTPSNSHFYLSPVAKTFLSATSPRMGEMTDTEQKVYDLLLELHKSGYPFRAVVVGQAGAILESTNMLGPVMRITQQPSTGSNILTLASEDKSFELHITLNRVSKMVLVKRETPSRLMRLVRLLNPEGDSMCSLILADKGESASVWFDELEERLGGEIQL